jgi:hypothetical protein
MAGAVPRRMRRAAPLVSRPAPRREQWMRAWRRRRSIGASSTSGSRMPRVAPTTRLPARMASAVTARGGGELLEPRPLRPWKTKCGDATKARNQSCHGRKLGPRPSRRGGGCNNPRRRSTVHRKAGRSRRWPPAARRRGEVHDRCLGGLQYAGAARPPRRKCLTPTAGTALAIKEHPNHAPGAAAAPAPNLLSP